MSGNMDRLNACYRDLQAAEKKLADAIREELPLGAIAEWEHGCHGRWGVVCGHGYGSEIVVRSRTGKRYKLDARRIFSGR